MTLKTKFDKLQEVTILPLKLKGLVIAFYFGGLGLQYNVRYFKDLELKEIYFFENELEEVKEDPKLGFK